MYKPRDPESRTIVISIEIRGHITTPGPWAQVLDTVPWTLDSAFWTLEVKTWIFWTVHCFRNTGDIKCESHIDFRMQCVILALTGGKLLLNNIFSVARWTNWICWAIENVLQVYVFLSLPYSNWGSEFLSYEIELRKMTSDFELLTRKIL